MGCPVWVVKTISARGQGLRLGELRVSELPAPPGSLEGAFSFAQPGMPSHQELGVRVLSGLVTATTELLSDADGLVVTAGLV